MKRYDKKFSLRKSLLWIFLFILIASATLFAISWWENSQEYTGGSDTSVIEVNGEQYERNANIETVLLMGLDKFSEAVDNSSYSNDQQADFLMLYVLDNEAKTCKALHLNRDTMVEMNILGVAGMEIGTVKQQLALAHTYGNGQNVSCRNTAGAVSNLLMGASIDHYVSVTMDAVSVFNDMVGGVELEVLSDFTGVDDSLKKGETVLLDGEHALNYVRGRHGVADGTNADRMIRQRQYLDALYKTALKRADSDEAFIFNAVQQLSEYIVSDCYVQDIKDLFDRISNYEFLGFYNIEGKSVMGERLVEFYPDEEAVKKLAVELFYIPKRNAV